jgi:hypothetical protein
LRSTKQRIPWPTAVALFVVVIAFGAGCAYFNLFYNAETAFEEGERLGEDVDPRDRPTQPQRTQYQRAIRKSQMLIDEYPDSDHVDDALFLMGKSHLRLNEWSDALRNLDNLLANFPNSEFVEEAMYLKSLAHLGRGEEQTGLDWFARLRESFPEGRPCTAWAMPTPRIVATSRPSTTTDGSSNGTPIVPRCRRSVCPSPAPCSRSIGRPRPSSSWPGSIPSR